MKKPFIMLVLIVGATLSSGCVSYYHQRYPVIPDVEKPKLYSFTAEDVECLDHEVKMLLAYNFEQLLTYAKKLQVSVDSYNEEARSKNKEILGGK